MTRNYFVVVGKTTKIVLVKHKIQTIYYEKISFLLVVRNIVEPGSLSQ